MLVRAGVGRLTLVDRDYLDFSNLQRQSLYTENDVHAGLPKAVAAVRHLQAINSQVEVHGRVEDVHGGNALELMKEHDLLLDGTDNFETRFLINEVAVSLGIPWIYGACAGSYALTATFHALRPPCLACLVEDLQFGTPTATCDTVGIIAPIVHWTAGIQVAEALKILTGRLEALHGSLISWDAWTCQWQKMPLAAEQFAGCSVCRDRRFPYLAGDKGTAAAHLCGRNAVMLRPQQTGAFPLQQLRKTLAHLDGIISNEYLLKAQVEGMELVVFADGRCMVLGTSDLAVARSLYARYIGS
jgi:adenylyltransferase/sulfurtransferase